MYSKETESEVKTRRYPWEDEDEIIHRVLRGVVQIATIVFSIVAITISLIALMQ